MIFLLVSYGANLSRVDQNNNSALYIIKQNFDEIIAF